MPPLWIQLNLKGFGLWLPLFLLWPLLMIVWLLALPLAIFIGIKAWWGLWSLLNATRGTSVDIESEGERIAVRIV